MAKLVLKDGITVDIKNYTDVGIVFDADPTMASEINANMKTYDLDNAKIIADDSGAILAEINGMEYAEELYVTQNEITGVLKYKKYEVTREEKEYIDAAKILLGERI